MLEYLPKYLENRFEFKIQNLSDQALGAEINIVVPANKIWVPMSLMFGFVADATVITRAIRITLDNGVRAYAMNRLAVAPTAGITYSGSMYRGAGLTTSTVNNFPIELPSLPMLEGFRLKTSTTNMQAGDQYVDVIFGYMEADATKPA